MAEDLNAELRAKITEDALVNRKLIVNSIIDEKLIETVCIQIIKFNEEDDMLEADNPKYKRVEHPIFLFLNSHGGQVINSLAIIGIIELSRTPIITVGMGHVSSAATLILLSGHKRTCFPYTRIMIHEIGGGVEGKINQQEEYLGESKKLQEIYNKIIISRTKITKEQLNNVYKSNKDWSFGYKDAKHLGVVDSLYQF
jgi:ATP-dependent Clp protease protease subunit